MRNKVWIALAIFLVIPGMLFTVSCAKKMVKEDQAAAMEAGKKAEGGETMTGMKSGEKAGETAAEEKGMSEEQLDAAKRSQMMEARDRFVNEDIHFDFDEATLTPTAQSILKRKAEWLQDNPNASVTIEGHTDERGTNEYNLALGDRRAESAKRFLVNLGVSSSRLTTISYGEENPVDPGHNEEAWSKNRRAHFVIN